MHQPRFYRNTFNTVRFASFTLQYRDTDLWIGVDHGSFSPEMAEFLQSEVVQMWQGLEGYIQNHTEFKTAHAPVTLLENAPEAAILMAEGWQSGWNRAYGSRGRTFCLAHRRNIEAEIWR
jgi:uncharacterized protein